VLDGFQRGDDLALRGHLGEARGEIHGVAEDVVVALHQRAVVEADAHPRRTLSTGAMSWTPSWMSRRAWQPLLESGTPPSPRRRSS
jgi:hypothetical protein